MTTPHLPMILFFFFLMIRRPPRSTLDRSSAASDVYKRQGYPVRFRTRTQLGFDRGPVSANLFVDHINSYRNTQVSPSAVSYTHLRAHETVLDLVCRLLLEKKKDEKKKHTLALTDFVQTTIHRLITRYQWNAVP